MVRFASMSPLGASVYTDAHSGYKGLDTEFVQGFVDHVTEIVYVRGDIHTNGLENFWSLFKRVH